MLEKSVRKFPPPLRLKYGMLDLNGLNSSPETGSLTIDMPDVVSPPL